MSADFRRCTPDPDYRVNGLRLLQRTDGVWVAVDESRRPGDQAVFLDRSRQTVENWMKSGSVGPGTAPKTVSQTWTLTLTKEDIAYVKQVGQARNDIQRAAGSHDGAVMDSKQIDMVGAVGEYAVVRLLKLPWLGEIKSYSEWCAYRENGADVGDLEVKTTKHPNGRLFVRRNGVCHGERPYVLARLAKTQVMLAGWAYGDEIKRPHNFWDPGHGEPAYYLANTELRAMEHLQTWLAKRERP